MPEQGHPPMRALGFDFGLRRIGVAVGQRATGTATPLLTLTIRGGQPPWADLDRLAKTWQPECMVVGLPTHADGKPHPLRQPIQDFIAMLARRFGLPIYTVDERLSSAEAYARLDEVRRLRSGRRRIAKTDIDCLAAAIILETWLTGDHRPCCLQGPTDR